MANGGDRRPIALTIVCERAHDDRSCAEFGLQDRAGEVHPGTPLAGGSTRFEAPVDLAVARDGSARVRGEFVHGRADAPFAYLSCRAADGTWRFRLKVPLAGVAETLAVDASTWALTGRVRATRGGTVPLIHGWTSSAAPEG